MPLYNKDSFFQAAAATTKAAAVAALAAAAADNVDSDIKAELDHVVTRKMNFVVRAAFFRPLVLEEEECCDNDVAIDYDEEENMAFPIATKRFFFLKWHVAPSNF